jgi:hypothetical protein
MPHQICHAHCPKGGGGLGIIAAVVAAAVIAAAARPVVHAAAVALEVAAIVVASAAALAVLGVMAYGGVRLHRWHARARRAIPQRAQADQALTEAHKAAIGTSRPRPVYVITSLGKAPARTDPRHRADHGL